MQTSVTVIQAPRRTALQRWRCLVSCLVGSVVFCAVVIPGVIVILSLPDEAGSGEAASG